MASNSGLSNANKAKKDEFYTQLLDIEAELQHYTHHFKDKTVLCNCDDPYESNFFKYFALNFNHLGLKRLIATCYDTSPMIGEQLSMFPERKPYMISITEVMDTNGDGSTDLSDVTSYLLQNKHNVAKPLQSGDFRSEECIALLKESDIVVTNPPFSLFREYIALLVKHDKQFLIIGNVNAITYKEVFPLIKDNKLWMGYSIHSGDREFRVPDDYPLTASSYRIDQNGKKYIRVKGVRWFTNMDYVERHVELDLWKKYTPEDYPKYDNYNAINVDKVSEIPCDYYECMGVPITFLDKYNPMQFEIVNANDIRKDSVQIRPKAHGLIKDQEATITTPDHSHFSHVERERERERERESTNNIRSSGHPQTNLDGRMHLQANTQVLEARGSLPASSLFAKSMEILINEYGLQETDIQYNNGIIGVPITYLDKYNPGQFEIIGCTESEGKGFSNGLWNPESTVAQPLIQGERKYKRIFIRRKTP